MKEYTEVRTITGRKIFVRKSKAEIREERIYWAEVILAPLVVIAVFAKFAGMI